MNRIFVLVGALLGLPPQSTWATIVPLRGVATAGVTYFLYEDSEPPPI
mgnify:CR=1 FL=1